MGAFAFRAHLTRFTSSAVEGTHLPGPAKGEPFECLQSDAGVAETFLLQRKAGLHPSQRASIAPLLGCGKRQFRGVATPGGILLAPKPRSKSTSPESGACICLVEASSRPETWGVGYRECLGPLGVRYCRISHLRTNTGQRLRAFSGERQALAQTASPYRVG